MRFIDLTSTSDFNVRGARCRERLIDDVTNRNKTNRGAIVMANMNVSSNSTAVALSALNGTSVLVCLLAIILVLVLKLHRKIVYRLSLYQVVSGMSYSTVQMLQIMFINYDASSEVYRGLCITMGFLTVFTQLVKLHFTMWVTFHLFCFVVVQKNLKRLERLYVVTSLLIPAMIAIVPVATGSYNFLGVGCFIGGDGNNASDFTANVELFAVFTVPIMLILFAASVAMMAMVICLVIRVSQRRKQGPITQSDPYWKALKQLLPLSTYPIIIFVLTIPALVFDIYASQNSIVDERILTASAVFVSLWAMVAGIALILHVCVLYNRKMRDTKNKAATYGSSDAHMIDNVLEPPTIANSCTSFPLPRDSVGDSIRTLPV